MSSCLIAREYILKIVLTIDEVDTWKHTFAIICLIIADHTFASFTKAMVGDVVIGLSIVGMKRCHLPF